MNLKHKLRAKINPIEFGHTGFHAVHEGVEAAAPRGVARAPAVPAGGAAGHGAAGGVPDPPGPPARQAELAARHEGHREDVAQPAARHLGRPLALVRDLHLAPAPLPGMISDPHLNPERRRKR